jgi:hypothetical protein
MAAAALALTALNLSMRASVPAGYAGIPFEDSRYSGGAQRIPGVVWCAYYDLGGEGVAYHDTDVVNHGSGKLNPADGTYLNEFRIKEGVDTSYTKYHDAIDRNPFNEVQPPEGLLYVGWTEAGEWFNLTVNVDKAGSYSADLLYTAARNAEIAVDVNFRPAGNPIQVVSTATDAEPIKWRNWHHWNLAKDTLALNLAQGLHVLTIRIVSGGNMNLCSLDFHPTK